MSSEDKMKMKRTYLGVDPFKKPTLKLTATGRWLLKTFLDKEPDGDDRELAAVVDVLQSHDVAEPIDEGFQRVEEIAIELNLLSD